MSQPHPPDPGFDPRRISVRGGVIFHPWVNIPVCVLLTLASAATTAFLARVAMDVAEEQPYPDQGLDQAGALIGAAVMGLVTLILIGATVYVVRWWRRVARLRRGAQGPGAGQSAR